MCVFSEWWPIVMNLAVSDIYVKSGIINLPRTENIQAFIYHLEFLEFQRHHMNPVHIIGFLSLDMAKQKRQKVVTTAEEVAVSVDLEEGWLDKLLELPIDELTKLLGDIANHGKVKTAAIKMARTSLPSFSSTKWIDFAERFGLHNKLENNQFEQVITPVYHLPPSLHEIMFEAAWHVQDVYQERREQRREVARVRIVDPVHPQSLCFFQS
jgi:hypothetical protein